MSERAEDYGRPQVGAMSMKEAVEKYQHIDHLLSDPIWLGPDNPRGAIIHDLWKAVKQASDIISVLQKQASELASELRNIAEARPSEWENPNDFRAWAQNRARHTLKKVAEPEKPSEVILQALKEITSKLG